MAESGIDIIVDLFDRPFHTRTFNEKAEIVKNGRPLPNLHNLKKKGKKFVRSFNNDFYNQTVWLCGSEPLCKLFCWPCILFVNDNSPWNSKLRGYSDLNNLHTAISRHEKSESHIHAWISLRTFGSSRIDLQLDSQQRESVVKHNETVKQNREILKRLIAVTCFLGKQELAFRGHSEGRDSNNRGNYVQLLNLLAEFDAQLNQHLKTATVFTGLSSLIQNDLIQSVNNVMISEVKSQIQSATFVAILVDETSDVTNFSQLSIVFRYVYNSNIYERFVGFHNVSSDRSAQAIATLVIDCLDQFNCKDKLVAQTYDGASVMAGQLGGVQAKVRELVPEALFIHCYAHKLNLVLSQATSCISACRIFFASISGFATFFSHSSKRTNLLDTIVKKRFPKLAPTRWNYSSRLVQTIAEYRNPLKELFECILDNPSDWDHVTINEAGGFLSKLGDFEFNLLLAVFTNIFSMTDVVFNILQSKSLDITYCSREMRDLKEKLCTMRNCGFDDIWTKIEIMCDPPRKRRKGDTSVTPKDEYKRMYCEIHDTVNYQLQYRFDSLPGLSFIEIFDCQKFSLFSKEFPEEQFSRLREAYGKNFDLVRLRSELKAMFVSQHFKDKYVTEIHSFLLSKGIHSGLPELHKLCELILTLPASSSSVERSFSALKRTKTFIRNSQGQSRLSALALMTIEKDLLVEMKGNDDFYNKVTEDFSKKGRRVEFNYK
jgi:hypothetical protein